MLNRSGGYLELQRGVAAAGGQRAQGRVGQAVAIVSLVLGTQEEGAGGGQQGVRGVAGQGRRDGGQRPQQLGRGQRGRLRGVLRFPLLERRRQLCGGDERDGRTNATATSCGITTRYVQTAGVV